MDMALTSGRGAFGLVLCVLAPGAVLPAFSADWVRLISGDSLSGWKTTGKAQWTVENGELLGRQGPNGEPGDIFTHAQWKNFEVEAEWRMTFPGNSGLWFRWAGPKTGCQADFLENEPAFPGVVSGSVYCMGRQFIGVNKDPSAVRRNDWNRLRIRAAGDEIVVWLNGREVVRTHDDSQPGPGSIGVQVHAGKQFTGMEVRVRNLRVRAIE
jgi:hypothetical protein